MSRLPLPRIYLVKILAVSFVGVHIPMIGAVAFILLSADISIADQIDVLVALLIATVIGTAMTMAMLFLLLSPVNRAARALHDYLSDRALPSLPTRYEDEAGVLLANVQEAVTRLDTAIDTARGQRDEAIREHRHKFELLAGMSHDLRTPLNHVIGFAEMMTTEALGPLGTTRYRDYASDIRDSGGDLLTTLQTILDLSAIEADGDEPPSAPVDLCAAVGQAVRLTHFHTDRTGVTVNTVAVPSTGPTVLVADRSLKQILLHSLHAAIGGTDAATRLDVSVQESEDRGVLTVTGSLPWADGDLPATIAHPAAGQGTTAPAGANDIRSSTPTALRLALVQSLSRSAGASVAVTTAPGGGRSISIAFRRVRGATAPRAA